MGLSLAIPGDKWLCLLLVTIAGALAMLGPGRWSIDARLFGWKRVEVHLAEVIRTLCNPPQ